MTATTTTARPRGASRISLEWVAPAVLVVAALLLIVNLSRSNPDRRALSVVNRSGAPVTVDVTDASRDGWLGVGTVDPTSRKRIDLVLDQGRVWRFELSVGPERLGEIRRTGDRLRADGWTLTIPEGVADQLPARQRGR
jgi:hypothetical protein